MQTNLYTKTTHKSRARFTERRAFQIVTENGRKMRKAVARANRARKAAFIVAAVLFGSGAEAASARCDTDSACAFLSFHKRMAPSLQKVFTVQGAPLFICHWKGGAVSACTYDRAPRRVSLRRA